MRITKIRHPEYADDCADHEKWRLTYKGGRHFIERYLKRFSKRETKATFEERRCITYSPSFAKAAVNKLKNTFYSRMSEIIRKNGPQSYQDACNGNGGGVDLYGSSMNAFIGQYVLDEIMVMKQVGVYVDRPPFDGNLLSNNKDKIPYLYTYTAEDILSWSYYYDEGEYVYRALLLRDNVNTIDETTGLSMGLETRYRQMWIGEDGLVHMQFWIPAKDDKADDDIKLGPEIILPLTRLPFIIAGIKESLLSEAADYQIALLNVASSDVNYVWRGNFPIYTEQFDPTSESVHMRRPRPQRNPDPNSGDDPTAGTRDEGIAASPTAELDAGSMTGRKYPKNTDRPDFIAPPTEPLLASMKKQEQMIAQIYQLIDIATSNAEPQHASAESKQMDTIGIDSGLSYIGLELEYLEREIGKIWAEYENSKPPNILYPTKYKLKSDKERVEEADSLDEIKTSVPSRTFGKEIGKRIAWVMLKDKIPAETMNKIETEIDSAEYTTSDPEVIKTASELGMVDAVTGSNALGFDGAKVVPIAEKEHTKRLAEIAASQAAGAPRGVDDKAPIKGKDENAEQEKENPDGTKKKQRGVGK